jgi:hypothetical protein
MYKNYEKRVKNFISEVKYNYIKITKYLDDTSRT